MPSAPTFRPYQPADLAACLALFDGNCPEFFAPNERDDLIEFLAIPPVGYEVCLLDNNIVGAFGVLREERSLSLRWIQVSHEAKGRGLGRTIMDRAVATVRASGGGQGDSAARGPLHIAASNKSAPFFASSAPVKSAAPPTAGAPACTASTWCCPPPDPRRLVTYYVTNFPCLFASVSRSENRGQTPGPQQRATARDFSAVLSGPIRVIRGQVTP